MRISVIGLGKVGSCMVASYASKGHQVIGSDINPALVETIGKHIAPFEESNLANLLHQHSGRITTTLDVKKAVQESELTFIIVPTPSEESGAFSTKYVESACEAIGAALKEKNEYHVITVVSTMLPGDSRARIIPTLERASGKKCGTDFGYAYSPSFIALGTIVKNILHPDFHLLGEFDQKSGDTVASFYTTANNNSAPIERMSVESAEIAKIALNAYVTSKITFANTLADLCHNIPHADVDSVTNALGKDRRIGAAYLGAGLGYGGPCFPRDNKAFAMALKRGGVEQNVPMSVHDYNERMVESVWEKVFASLPKTAHITVLGLSYKPDTPYIDEAQGVKFVQKLLDEGFAVTVYDPPPMADIASVFGERVHAAKELSEALERADVVFISYPSPSFDPLMQKLVGRTAPITIIDPWRTYRPLSTLPAVTYIPLGIGPVH